MGGGTGAGAESLAACGDCKPWLCGQTGDSNRQVRCFWTATLSLSSAPCTQTPRGSYSLSVCVVGGCSSGLGLEHIFVCVCVERVHLSVCGFKCLVLDVCLRVNLQPSVFFSFQTDCE